ncbi:MAG: PDZ domain-containing protein, partial [Acidobacteria bacterium ACB2]|nr:PDZ domain-containing protein [Acidobacteria bacterium ACB2]
SSRSPAEAAGIQAGDVVVAVDGRPLPDAREVPALITSLAGRKVRFDLLRGGRPLSVDVSLHPASP